MDGQQMNGCNLEFPGFEQWNFLDADNYRPVASVSRCSKCACFTSEFSKPTLASKLLMLEGKIKHAGEDFVELRQEASDLREYANAKLDRVSRYLTVLADKARNLDQDALETDAKMSQLSRERKIFFDNFLKIKGNFNVFCRTRPLFEHEGPSIVEYPDDFTIRLITREDPLDLLKIDLKFDKVYGPHVGQAELFTDIQPFVQSALDGNNVSLFAYGQTGSGKTYTMEGSKHDRGLYARCVEELFDLSNLGSTVASRFNFYITIFELYNEQVRDLLAVSENSSQIICFGLPDLQLVQEQIDSPLTFSKLLKAALRNRTDLSQSNASHLILTIHICYNNTVTGENLYSKLSLVDLAASDGLNATDNTIRNIDELLNLNTFSALVSSPNSVGAQYEKSILTKLMVDSLGKSSKLLVILNICPNATNVFEALSCLSFFARARNYFKGQDAVLKSRIIASDGSEALHEKEQELNSLKLEISRLRKELSTANDQGLLLLNEVQKAWKVSSTMQSNLKSMNAQLEGNYKVERDEKLQLKTQLAEALLVERDQKMLISQQKLTIQNLQAKVDSFPSRLNGAIQSNGVIQKLGEEVVKHDALFESHQPWEPNPPSEVVEMLEQKKRCTDIKGLPLPNSYSAHDFGGDLTLCNQCAGKAKTTPAGEYLISSLDDFDTEQYDSLAAISDGANKILMLVLAAVIKAGASREHEMLSEIRVSVCSFIRRMEPKRVMDSMLVARVRILYLRSLLARSQELQSIKVPPISSFLEKANAGDNRSSSQSSTPRGSQCFKVDIKKDKRSRFSSVVLKVRGIDQDIWRQHVTSDRLRELTEEAKSFSIGNTALAALFVHSPAGELQRHIRSWLAENFEFLAVTGNDSGGETSGQLEMLSAAIIDGWMAGLGAAAPPSTDAFGQLLSEYTKTVYSSQLLHLKDIGSTLTMEVVNDSARILKLRSDIESVYCKRKMIMQQMKSDGAILASTDDELVDDFMQNRSVSNEDARLASLISLEDIIKQVKDVLRESMQISFSKTKKEMLLGTLYDLSMRIPTLLEIDHPCAHKYLADAKSKIVCLPDGDRLEESSSHNNPNHVIPSTSDVDVSQWIVLQFNTGSTSPFIIKCGSNSNSELVVKTSRRVNDPESSETVMVIPRPAVLKNMSLEDTKELFARLPEALSLLSLARTADGTRARYSRLYRTLALKLPALRGLVDEMEKGGMLTDARSGSAH